MPTSNVAINPATARPVPRRAPRCFVAHNCALVVLARLALRLDAGQRSAMIGKLSSAALAIVEKDPKKWSAYVPAPLWVAPSPSSPLTHLFPHDVQSNLDFEIASQNDDGSWRPRWRWRDYAEDWPEAEREWAGILTLEALLQLRDYGRIAVS